MKRLPTILRPVLATIVLALLAAAGVALAIEELYGVPLTVRNFRFERPPAATLMAAGALVLIARGYMRRRRAPRLSVSRGLDLRALPEGPRIWIEPLLVAARVVTVLLMALSLMGPQSIHARDATEVQGIDIILTVDLSLSMQAADIRPNRFVAAQAVVDEFIQRRPNDRIGAVIFGRDAHTLLPLTTDHEALRGMFAELELGVIEGRGTAIGNAVGTALNRLRKSDAKSKVVILLTDGDSNSGNVSPMQAAEFAKALGVKVYTVLMGRTGDAPVQSGLDLFGRPLFDRGNFPVNPELLKKVAAQTGGENFVVADREALERSFHTILDRLERSQIKDAGKVYGELFPAFLAPALLLLLFEIVIAAVFQRRWP
jgi:Ca-activated chloride channel family protein